ncbi:MAG TPA: hypothetical protein VGG14_08935 [Candidatus Sulfotelmatobacter sp.]|jgi:hypothetical protein
MNYKVQLSPISPPPKPHLFYLGIDVNGSDVKPTTLRREDARFFRSWLVYDSDMEHSRTKGRLNWSVIAGFAIMAAVSAGGWYGFTTLLQHFLK